jgi:hypothetical protein
MDELTLADILQIDADKYELPKDYTPRDVAILQWRFIRERDNSEDLKLAKFEIKTLEAEIKKLKAKKAIELAKPLKKKVYFKDLLDQLLTIHLKDSLLASFDKNSIPEIDREKIADLVEECAKLIVLLTTYIQNFGVDENGRRILFEDLNSEDWFRKA